MAAFSTRLASGKDGKTCLEGVLLQSNRQARQRLVSGSGFRDDGEAGGRAIVVAGSDLDAGDVGRLV